MNNVTTEKHVRKVLKHAEQHVLDVQARVAELTPTVRAKVDAFIANNQASRAVQYLFHDCNTHGKKESQEIVDCIMGRNGF